jgi:hypothetical protein
MCETFQEVVTEKKLEVSNENSVPDTFFYPRTFDIFCNSHPIKNFFMSTVVGKLSNDQFYDIFIVDNLRLC